MPKINFHLVVYRYEMIVALIILLLTGSIVVSSKDRPLEYSFQNPRYPYRIALTFDDGPHPYYTERIISILREHNAAATFFVVGRQAIEYPQLVKSLSLSGHELAVHGFTHRNLTKLSSVEIARELSLTCSVLEDISGSRCRFFRPPGGKYSAKVVETAGSIGQEMELWSVFPKDHEENDAEKIVNRVLGQATDGGVVLLHSGREPTLAALPLIIKSLKDKGYQPVTLTQIKPAPRETRIARLR